MEQHDIPMPPEVSPDVCLYETDEVLLYSAFMPGVPQDEARVIFRKATMEFEFGGVWVPLPDEPQFRQVYLGNIKMHQGPFSVTKTVHLIRRGRIFLKVPKEYEDLLALPEEFEIPAAPREPEIQKLTLIAPSLNELPIALDQIRRSENNSITCRSQQQFTERSLSLSSSPLTTMHSRASQNRLSTPSRISVLLLAMFATMAAVYVAGRLWQDAENRVYLIQELDKRTGQGQSAISVDDTLKVITCREQQKKLSELEMDLAAATQEGFVPKHLSKNDGTRSKKKLLAVIGIMTTFGRKKNRDAIRKAWMPTGAAVEKLANEKGIIVRFVIGRSANHGDSLDREIDIENRHTTDFIILDGQVEAPEESPKKMKSFFIHAVENWDAEFYAKVNDDVYVNIDALGAMLTTHMDKPRVYIGCMKSGEVFSEQSHKWYEPEWWKFGDKKSYFRHASGEMYVMSRALAQFISINKSILRTYAHDDVSTGSWFIGLDVKHINEAKFCCSSSSSGAICAAV